MTNPLIDSSLGQTCSRTLRFGKMVSFRLLPSWIYHLGSRKRQVMSPTAHLPIVPTVLPMSVMDWSYDTEIANDLYQFTDNNGLCRRTLHIVSAQFTNKLICLLSFSLFALACIASLLASLMRLVRCPPGSLRGVGSKKSQRSSFFLFARPCLQNPQAGCHLFLGFTPGSRPRVRGPAPLLLTKLGCLPGPVCGVREKKASRALSLSLLLHLLFFTVFTQATSPQESEPEKVLFYPVDCPVYGFTRQLYQRSPQNGEIQKFACAQVCERNLPKSAMAPKVPGAFGGQRVPIFTHDLHTFY